MANNLRDFYVAVMKTGQAIHYTELEMLKALDSCNVACFLKAVYCEVEKKDDYGRWGIRNFYHYFMIDKDGDYTKYARGNYKLAAIGPEQYDNRDITFSNRITGKVYRYRSTETPDRFIFYELKPLLEKFNELNDDEKIQALCNE